MTRLTIIGFLLLSGFFYLTGKPIDQNHEQDIAAQLLRGTSGAKPAYPAPPAVSMAIAATEAVLTPTAATASMGPELPPRNPDRNDTVAVAVATPGSDATTEAKGGSKGIVAEAPRSLGLRDRFAEPQPTVLGPRLTAVLIKRELRRVGCYEGNISGNWDDSARSAVEAYNSAAAAQVVAESPDVATLTALQRQQQTVCNGAPGAGKGTRVAATGLATTTARVADTVSGSGSQASGTAGSPVADLQWQASEPRQRVAYEAPEAAGERRMASADSDAGETSRVYRIAPAIEPRLRRKHVARSADKMFRFKNIAIAQPFAKAKTIAIAQPFAKAKTAVRGWSKAYRPKKFGFSTSAGGLSLNY